MAPEERILGASPGTGGVVLLTDSSMGKVLLLRMKKFPWFEVPPEAPGFVTDTATSPAAVSAVAGTCTVRAERAPAEG